MRTKLRFALAALTAAVLGGQPLFAQQPEAELKKAQEQLEKLLKELKDREAKKAETAKPVPPPPVPPKATVAWAQLQPAGDANGALKALTASKDPKVAEMAKQLLEHLSKAAPQPGKPLELHLQLAKPAAGGGTFEFKTAPDTKPGSQLEFKVVPFPGTPAVKAEPAKPVEARVVVVGEKLADPVRSVTFSAKAEGASTLKLSADGKTAALLAGDGTITIFDVATGKETMKFKK
jgi:hypothetical protein